MILAMHVVGRFDWDINIEIIRNGLLSHMSKIYFENVVICIWNFIAIHSIVINYFYITCAGWNDRKRSTLTAEAIRITENSLQQWTTCTPSHHTKSCRFDIICKCLNKSLWNISWSYLPLHYEWIIAKWFTLHLWFV